MKKVFMIFTVAILIISLVSVSAFAASQTLPSNFYALNDTDNGKTCVFSLPSLFKPDHDLFKLNWHGSGSNALMIYSSSKQWIYLYQFKTNPVITSVSTTSSGKLIVTFSSVLSTPYWGFSASSGKLLYAMGGYFSSTVLTLDEGDYICSTDYFQQSILPKLGEATQALVDKNVINLPADRILFVPAETTHTLTVQYKFENGTQALEPYSNIYAKGQSFLVNSPKIMGFKPDKTVVSGTMGDANLSHVVTYSKAVYALNISYRYEDDTQAFPTLSKTYAEGDSYLISSPNLDGYTPTKNEISGTMGNENVSYSVVYKKNPPPPSSSEDSSSGNPSTGSEYVIWNPQIMKGGFQNITQQAGSAFNTGIWVFLMIAGIILAVKLVRGLTK